MMKTLERAVEAKVVQMTVMQVLMAVMVVGNVLKMQAVKVV
jgi:hypothetical protein